MNFLRFTPIKVGVGILILTPILTWVILYIQGKQFALRDRLEKADAIVAVAGTRFNIRFINSKIQTAVNLYKQGWAPKIIFSGKFSDKVKGIPPQLVPLNDLRQAVADGRIQMKDIEPAAANWDQGLGATYMRDQAIRMGAPCESILVETEALHTRENAELTTRILEDQRIKKIILITSPFHQKRTYLSFAKALEGRGVKVINYHADTNEWHPLTWFFSTENRKLVRSEEKRIRVYRKKGDIL